MDLFAGLIVSLVGTFALTITRKKKVVTMFRVAFTLTNAINAAGNLEYKGVSNDKATIQRPRNRNQH